MVESVVVGIDPGMAGGIAAYGWNSQKLVAYSRMPTIMIGQKKHVDAAFVHRFMVDVDADVVVIEQVHAMPGQGVTSTFTFGQGYGSVCGAASIFGVVTEFVTPQKWKKAMNLSKDKRASLDAASRFWPNAVDWSVKANDGIAEAALIAKWYTERTGSAKT